MNDCQKGFTLGPFPLADFPEVHTSRIGVIPKKHQPGKYRLIVDLSSPAGRSVNDGIAKEVCSLSYTKIDDIVECILFIWHYLDDFLVAGHCSSAECFDNISTVRRLCEILGIPLAEEKSAGPSTALAILGIEVDTDRLVLRLPPEKLARICFLLEEWASKKTTTKKELQSFIGQLQHASTIIKLGRRFLRQMYDMLSLAQQPHHHIRLNDSIKSDLAWWRLFLATWEGSAMMSPSRLQTPSAVVTSDASGSLL